MKIKCLVLISQQGIYLTDPCLVSRDHRPLGMGNISLPWVGETPHSVLESNNSTKYTPSFNSESEVILFPSDGTNVYPSGITVATETPRQRSTRIKTHARDFLQIIVYFEDAKFQYLVSNIWLIIQTMSEIWFGNLNSAVRSRVTVRIPSPPVLDIPYVGDTLTCMSIQRISYMMWRE